MYRLINSSFGNYSIETNVNISQILEICNQPDTITFIDKTFKDKWKDFFTINTIDVIANENTKTLKGISEILDILVDRGVTKKTKIVAIGGGVIQDVVGFIASIWCRGLDYVLIPTTVLSQIDSCVGGKTSINHINKNILGTFWPPKRILICTDFLNTLDSMDYWSGWGEWIKYKILQNKFEEVIDTIDDSLVGNELKLIQNGISYKIDIIEKDEFDVGDRKFLNFGHTFGHALECISEWKIPHGYAVFIGSLIAMIVSEKYYNSKIVEIDLLKEFSRKYFNLGNFKDTINFDKDWFGEDVIGIAKKSDKKQTDNNGINMILIKHGRPTLQKITDDKILIDSLEIVYNEICF